MTIRHSILALLAQKSRHGYDLLTAFEALAGGKENWEVKPAQISTTLSRLEKAGMITPLGTQQDAGPEKRIFALTEAGKAMVMDWFHQPLVTPHQRDAFFIKLMLCLGTDGVSARELIYIQRASLYQALHSVTAQRAKLNPHQNLAHSLLLEQVNMHLEADLRWLEMVEARLDEISRQPMPAAQLKPRGRKNIENEK